MRPPRQTVARDRETQGDGRLRVAADVRSPRRQRPRCSPVPSYELATSRGDVKNSRSRFSGTRRRMLDRPPPSRPRHRPSQQKHRLNRNRAGAWVPWTAAASTPPRQRSSQAAGHRLADTMPNHLRNAATIAGAPTQRSRVIRNASSQRTQKESQGYRRCRSCCPRSSQWRLSAPQGPATPGTRPGGPADPPGASSPSRSCCGTDSSRRTSIMVPPLGHLRPHAAAPPGTDPKPTGGLTSPRCPDRPGHHVEPAGSICTVGRHQRGRDAGSEPTHPRPRPNPPGSQTSPATPSRATPAPQPWSHPTAGPGLHGVPTAARPAPPPIRRPGHPGHRQPQMIIGRERPGRHRRHEGRPAAEWRPVSFSSC
jgi:hypothetical protein